MQNHLTLLIHHLKSHYPTESLQPRRLEDRAKRTLDWCQRTGTRLLFTHQHPELLPLISSPGSPSLLFARGNIELLKRPSIAVVGTRRASAYGLRVAVAISRGLAERGVVVTSGLALGIDAAANSAAWEVSREGIAVLAHGLDSIYPKANAALGERLANEGGLLLSEYFPGTPALKHQFPERNRIVAGISLGTVVVEAPEKSGALITARLAGEFGREVFVVPGGYGDTGFSGNHRLLHEGAKLVTSVDDILEEFAHLPWACAPGEQPELPFDGVFSLEDVLQSAVPGLAPGREGLEEALRRGMVVEISPQRYTLAHSIS